MGNIVQFLCIFLFLFTLYNGVNGQTLPEFQPNGDIILANSYQTYYSYILKTTNNVSLTHCNVKIESNNFELSTVTLLQPKGACLVTFDINNWMGNFSEPIELTYLYDLTNSMIISLNVPFKFNEYKGNIELLASASLSYIYYGFGYRDSFTSQYLFKLQGKYIVPTLSQGNSELGNSIAFYNPKGLVSGIGEFSVGMMYMATNQSLVSVRNFSTPFSNPNPIYQGSPSGEYTYVETDLLLYNINYGVISNKIDQTHFVKIERAGFKAIRYMVFPYGYSSGHLYTLFQMAISLPISPAFNGQSTWTMSSNPVNTDTYFGSAYNVNPVINSAEWLYTIGQYYVYRVTASEPQQGIHKITDGVDMIANYDSWVSGTELNPTFEFMTTKPLTSVTVISNNALSSTANVVSTVKQIKMETITAVTYLHNDIELNITEPFRTTVFINSTDPNGSLALIIPRADKLATNPFYGVYDLVNQVYVFEIVLQPRSSVGEIYYEITGIEDMMLNSILIQAFDLGPALRVTSFFVDQIGPTITAISGNGPITITENTGYTELILSVTISDPYNGLLNGSIWFSSEYDPIGFNFTFTSEGKNKYLDTYTFKANMMNSMCKTQAYILKDVKLMDTSLITTSTYNPYMNPLTNEFSNSGLSVTCTQTNDLIQPSLLSFSILNASSIDVSLENRNVVIEFKISDDVAGIDPDKSGPIVYAEEYGFKSLLSARSVIIDKVALIYRATIELPYGYGLSRGVYFSIYGIVDNSLNLNGYSTDKLRKAGFDYKITTTTTYTPLIKSTNTIFKKDKGGTVTLFGTNFGIDSSNTILEYTSTTETDDWTTVPSLTILSHSVITFSKGDTTVPFKIRITKRMAQSNVIVVTPYIAPNPIYIPPAESSESSSATSSSSSTVPSSSSSENITVPPTETPNNNCPGTTPCNERGYCQNGFCICKSPFVGLDCSSEIIIVPEPPIDPEKPDIDNNVDGDDINYNTLITIDSIRELDMNGKSINHYKFKQWIYTNITSSSDKPTYLYTTTIEQSNLVFKMNVTILWFEKYENITFANQQLNMQPSSIKYRIDLDPYQFTSQLNSLQVIMKASFGSSKGQCSITEKGNLYGDDEFISLQVDDHSLYGRFIKRGIVDGAIKGLTNSFLNSVYDDNSQKLSDTSSTSQTYIAMNIPFYTKQVALDPDFSILINNKPASEKEGSLCEKKKSSLTTAQIAGIAVGAFGFACVIGISAIYYVVQKKKQKKMQKDLEAKLSKIDSTKL